MTPYIASRIRQCYPTHRLEEVNADACNFEYAGRVYPRLVVALASAGASITEFRFGVGLERVVSAKVTSQHATYRVWHSMTQDQQEWYLKDQGSWVQLCLSVSTVAPCFHYWFNVFRRPTDEEQKEDASRWMKVDTPDAPPTDEWKDILSAVRRACEDAGLVELSEEEKREEVPFVLERIFDFRDDSDMDDEEDAPEQLEPANVAQCLFQGH